VAERGDPSILEFEVPLLAAEAKLTLITRPQGNNPQAQIVLELAPAAFTGNTPGIQYDVRLTRMEALHFWKVLVKGQKGEEGWVRSWEEMLRSGDACVPGRNYGRMGLWLNPECKVLIFLTADDCATIAQRILEALEYAKKRDKILL
jgi:hypothetical protein